MVLVQHPKVAILPSNLHKVPLTLDGDPLRMIFTKSLKTTQMKDKTILDFSCSFSQAESMYFCTCCCTALLLHWLSKRCLSLSTCALPQKGLDLKGEAISLITFHCCFYRNNLQFLVTQPSSFATIIITFICTASIIYSTIQNGKLFIKLSIIT